MKRVMVQDEGGRRQATARANEDGTISLVVDEHDPLREGVAVIHLTPYDAKWFGLHLAGMGADSLRKQREQRKKR